MIPSLPEAISATHVEYIPLPPVYLKPLVHVCGENNGSVEPDQNVQQAVWNEELVNLRTIRAAQQFIPPNGNAVPRSIDISLYRGSDLHYSPHVNVPAAESVDNL